MTSRRRNDVTLTKCSAGHCLVGTSLTCKEKNHFPIPYPDWPPVLSPCPVPGSLPLTGPRFSLPDRPPVLSPCPVPGSLPLTGPRFSLPDRPPVLSPCPVPGSLTWLAEASSVFLAEMVTFSLPVLWLPRLCSELASLPATRARSHPLSLRENTFLIIAQACVQWCHVTGSPVRLRRMPGRSWV